MPTQTPTRRKTSTSTPRTKTSSPPAPEPEIRPDSDDSRAATRASSATTRTDPLDLERGDFKPPEQPPPVRTARDFDDVDDYEPAPAELIDWTTERAGAVVKGGGFLLHTID